MARDDVRKGIEAASELEWGEPDMEVLRHHRRLPPALPAQVFGPLWACWIADAAEAAAAPVDYVAAALLASASALIGNARWAQAVPGGWTEPPHLWVGAIGDSGTGKSPAADCIFGHVLPEIEHRMAADFPDRLQDWRALAAYAKAAEDSWLAEVRAAKKAGTPAPLPPERPPLEPQAPRLRQSDVTIEKVASLLATAAPKGLLVTRDELAGWFSGMNAYNEAGRAFWVEAYGGRPYRVERQKSPEPIIVARLVVAVFGGVQPDRLATLMADVDDGLCARLLWCWPDSVPFRIGSRTPQCAWAVDAFDRLRTLDLRRLEQIEPVMVRLAPAARRLLEEFGRKAQLRQTEAGGLMRSAWGKARGHALRLSLVLEFLWWCGETGSAAPPLDISEYAFGAAAKLLDDYFLPMAERTYGDAALSRGDRNAATLARWIAKDRPVEVHVRDVQRKRKLPGLHTANLIREAADVLVEADWLAAPMPGEEFGPRQRVAYRVNPKLLAMPR